MPPAAAAPFHLMTKPIGAICNLDCGYCYYLDKENLYPGTRSFRMSPETLEAYVRGYIEAQPGEEVHFAWQGGEPTLLGVTFFEKVVALQRQYGAGRRIQNAMQTNGTLLDDRWGEFLARHNFLVGLSVDGPRDLHDAYRVDKGQKPTFDRVMRGLEVLRKHRVEFNLLCTVHRGNMRSPLEVYRFLRSSGIGYIQFIPIVERRQPGAPGHALTPAPDPATPNDPEDPGLADTPLSPWSVRSERFGEFLCTVFDEWVKRDVGTTFVQIFDVSLANWYGAPPGLCVFSETCGRALAVEHNGDVYSCDHYVEPRHRLGNLNQAALGEMVDSARQKAFGDGKKTSLPAYCRSCEVRFACHGECPKHRIIRTPDGEPGLNYLCAGYKGFFRHIDPWMRAMCTLLSRERPPAEVMRLGEAEIRALAAQWPRGAGLVRFDDAPGAPTAVRGPS